jgi:hypothetical protein
VSDPLTFTLPADVLEQIAVRAAEILAARLELEQRGTPWLRGARAIGDYIGAPPSRVYALVEQGDIPHHHDGSALVADTRELDEWIRNGGGRRR